MASTYGSMPQWLSNPSDDIPGQRQAVLGLLGQRLSVSQLEGQLLTADQIPVLTVEQSRPGSRRDEEILSWHDPSLQVPIVLPDMALECPLGNLEAILISESPRMIYLKDFVTEVERKHIIKISEPILEQSTVFDAETKGPSTDLTFRRSDSAAPPRDEIVKCIEQRARLAQPWSPGMGLEILSVQRYQKNGFFSHHWDSFLNSPGPDRKSTFNIFLDGNCTGGGTHFPELPLPDDPDLCNILDCDSKLNGTVFKPITGNAIFWENVRSDGSRYEETIHAGLPVEEGTKIGMNIWTWGFPDTD
ncbi:hypothetical protein BDV39DRAFT_204744 [Aspergillus sergii]|uniref:Prolyl 4-hydroxylase alpha subunit domain-containing protein n=1 Tax=Aspergillus sergii TaxID=1034303 RepID=A0A5N6X4G8_9EURO|nr:hypothetical protein BDV39DRAFT_204744 [Aspergillus sergii]